MATKKEFLDVSLEDLDKLAAEIYEFGRSHSIWLLEGNMGAGKTTFVKHLCQYLNITSAVQSPSFGIVNEYETKSGDTIYHFDCYRMRSEEEAYDIGLEEYLDSGHLCLIEWSEKIPSLIPTKFFKIEINLYNSTNRHFLVTQNG